ncbi:MAG: hypothetical protein QS98_C0005G0047 [archaeon GW2011_AR3]|nr:MAG: hypothetical protein QS98_C0005G0047 [archaeon GW2011_AR3]MBS3109447.1 hypothetical protein [Candidatus Woesearchaeota archaeon]
MEKATQFLMDWAREFIKNKNLIAKNLNAIEEKGSELLVKYRDREQVVLIRPVLQSFYDALKYFAADEDMHLAVVTFNTPEAFKALLDNWKELVKHRNFCVYFANPFSQTDKKWIIYPYTHSKICDEDSLEMGLRSMFETVDRISKEEIPIRV